MTTSVGTVLASCAMSTPDCVDNHSVDALPTVAVVLVIVAAIVAVGIWLLRRHPRG
ncbi:hypothetical protein [Curtobacterium sp. ISL-83]|uniref:hypothetical protein n=1 Tax=Curtobacterium sp. ISL-83 TaxID=2819145 RepID=UPI001BE7D10A|nr:hypothetical protein [Curtobacterium sp. ISL-83]MBT2503695.1 hypothetical protein [Curtobacterium sp. ISL-83]